jgi:8-oxo-dGTP diphosphatase
MLLYSAAVETRIEIADTGHQMARAPTLAAGGIVLRQEATPLIAVVRLRKRNEWVLPKGKLDDGETPRAAAIREVLEETGHEVSVHEFLGTLVYESGGRSKVVHYWRMETSGGQVYELMDDVKAVDWLPLDAAVERLSRGYERAFLSNVGPLALEAAAAARSPPRPKARQPVLEKRARRQVAEPRPSLAIALSPPSQPDLTSLAIGQDDSQLSVSDIVAATASVTAAESGTTVLSANEEPAAPAMEPRSSGHEIAATVSGRRRNLVQTVRAWLRGAA